MRSVGSHCAFSSHRLSRRVVPLWPTAAGVDAVNDRARHRRRMDAALTGRSSISLAGGPRLTGDQLSPEVSASLQSGHDRLTMSLAIERTETAVLGTARPVEVESLSGQFAWGRVARTAAGATPAWFQEPTGSIAAWTSTGWTSVSSTRWPRRSRSTPVRQSTTQSGRLHSSFADGSIDRYTSSVRLVVRPPGVRPW